MSRTAWSHWLHATGSALVLMVLTLPGMAAAQSPPITVAGSTTLLPALERLAEHYRDDQPDAQVEVAGGDSGKGIALLLAGDVDIASSSRFIAPAEVARSRQLQVYPVPFQVAYDAIIPIVHKSNPLRSLSLEQLRDIYAGRVDNWQQLGGADRNITVLSRESGSGTLAVWRQLVTGSETLTAGAGIVSSSEDVVRAVSRQRGAIGYIGLANLNANVKPLRVNEVIGSLSNVRAGTYTLSRTLYLFTAGWPQEQTLSFINFVLDPNRGQRVLGEAGLVPLHDHRFD